MTIVIEAKNTKEVKKILAEKLKKQKQGNLAIHFGKLQRNLDGLDYQTTIRENEG